MRKSRKRVIAIITCCFVLATFCVGVFADETTQEENIDPAMNRLGTVLTSTPFDLGGLVYTFSSVSESHTFNSGYYILHISCNYIDHNGYVGIVLNTEQNPGVVLNGANGNVIRYYNDNTFNLNTITVSDVNDFYVYIYIADDNSVITFNNSVDYEFNQIFNYIEFYSVSERSVIDSVYSNSQDVNSSIVSVINEATNVITTNDVVMMFCILIPVISFGVGILIRLRKRS